MKENVIKEKNVKIPLYVTVYETISEWLKEGKYKPGDKLPGENILAEQLNVSRGTLRQAMLLLQEDGFIVNQQGRGNIVLSAQRPAKAGLEKIENPLVDFCLQPVDKVETTVGFQPATQKHQEVLKLRASSIVAVINITYYSGDTVVGFAMVYMPYEVLDKSSVDLENPGYSIPVLFQTADFRRPLQRYKAASGKCQRASGRYFKYPGRRAIFNSGRRALFRI